MKQRSPPTVLILPLPPTMNTYWRAVGRGRVLISREGRAYRERCKLAAMAQRVRPLDGDVSVVGTVYFRDRRRDLDNAIKPLLDALHGHCYHDDRQVAHIDLRREIDAARPRVELTVESTA